jgi:dihydrofolate synthase/folylpolyglutamate synthase
LGTEPLPDSLAGWLTLLESRHPKAIDLGLDRCRRVWRRMGSPVPAPRTFLVAGTNGKGSTVATICSLLQNLGHRQGSYTTPHLLTFNERIRVNGEPTPDARILSAFERVEAARGDVSLTYFEFGTLAAFDLLSRSSLDFAVMEIGLGGRLDAVNLLDADVAVITPIGLDHQDFLGGDLESIGREKAGILRPGQFAVCGEPHPPASVLDRARKLGLTLTRQGVDFHGAVEDDRFRFQWGDSELLLPAPVLAGPHQEANLATALAAVLALLPEAAGQPDCLAAGVESVILNGRMERVSDRPAVWVDVGHNPLAARAVRDALERARAKEGIQEIHAVLAMLSDKDAASVVDVLQPVIQSWLLAGLEGERGQSGAELAGKLGHRLGDRARRVFPAVADALDAALSEARPEDGILVFGSFLTAADALRHPILLESPQRAGKRDV